jgi:hypothetical protein
MRRNTIGVFVVVIFLWPGGQWPSPVAKSLFTAKFSPNVSYRAEHNPSSYGPRTTGTSSWELGAFFLTDLGAEMGRALPSKTFWFCSRSAPLENLACYFETVILCKNAFITYHF